MGIRKPRNSIQHVWIAKVSLCYSFLSIHTIWEPTRYGLEEKTEILILSLYFMSNWNGKVLRFYSDTRASLPLLARALNSHFKVFLRSGRRKTGNCSFTAAPIGGKLDFPVFLRSERRKAGICSFTAAPIGGKVDFPVFLRSEWRKTGNSWYAADTYGGCLSIRFFFLFSLLLLLGGSWVGALFHKMKDGHVWITIGGNNIKSQ